MSAAENDKPNPPETPPIKNGVFGVMLYMAGMIEDLAHFAQHDDLTGLLTKEAVKHQTEERIEAGKPFGVFLMDWDAFKIINDTLGHERADQMLRDFGPYMDEHFRREGEVFAHEKGIRPPESDHEPDTLLGRYGGDEFVGLTNLSDREVPDGLTVVERMDKAEAYMRSVLTGFVELQGQDVRDLKYNISLGRAISEPDIPQTVSELFHMADQSMFTDKQAHGAPAR